MSKFKTHDFSGKTVVLTGAGGVLVSTFSVEFAKAGANVALLDLDKEAADRIAEEINKKYPERAKAYKCNVLDKESLQEVNNAIKKDFLKLCDILINGAGGIILKQLLIMNFIQMI